MSHEFEEVARLFNFRMMEPAPIEHLSILRAKSGADVDKEIYAFKDKGDRDVGLRFDLTVGMTRYVCSRRDLRPPVKLAALAGAWRYDEPQHARYRWFRQWDLETFGPPSLDSDAEVIEATSRLFERLGIEGFSIQVGDRGTVQSFVTDSLGVKDPAQAADLLRALDKVKKRSLSDLKAEYAKKGFDPDVVERLFEFGKLSGAPDKVLSRLEELKLEPSVLGNLADMLKDRDVPAVTFDLSIVRGIDYYTGVVFEVADSAHPDLGSLAGGGRYDLLPKSFGRADLTATGAAGGMERIALSMSKTKPAGGLVYVAFADTKYKREALKVQRRIRAAGVPSEASIGTKPLGKQLEDAGKLGAAWAVIVGEKEASSRSVTLRNMASRTEETLPLETALKRLSGP